MHFVSHICLSGGGRGRWAGFELCGWSEFPLGEGEMVVHRSQQVWGKHWPLTPTWPQCKSIYPIWTHLSPNEVFWKQKKLYSWKIIGRAITLDISTRRKKNTTNTPWGRLCKTLHVLAPPLVCVRFLNFNSFSGFLLSHSAASSSCIFKFQSNINSQKVRLFLYR